MAQQVVAVAKHIKQSPQKIRVVARRVSRLPLREAIAVLEQTPKKAADPIRKVIDSARANAVNNLGIDEAKLAIKELQVGRAMIRRKPEFGARGRLSWRRTIYSHIRVVLEEVESN